MTITKPRPRPGFTEEQARYSRGKCIYCGETGPCKCYAKVGSYEPTDWKTYNPKTKKYDKKYFAWEVTLLDGGGFSCKTQIEAEILSRLVRIEETLRRLEKKKHNF